jgi:hypothetical protein
MHNISANAPRSVAMWSISTILLTVTIAVLNGCGGSGIKVPAAKNTSLSELLTKLPNMKPHGIESCSYTVEKNSPGAPGGVPSPSDVRMELAGTVLLTADGAETLKSTFDWKPVRREDIPASLLAHMPAGDVLVSQKLNESFENNPTYRHGFVATIMKDGWSRVYFLATDLDHPIQ